MSILHISLPDSIRRFVDSQVGIGRFRDASEYVTALIEADQERKALDPADLEALRRQVAVGIEQLERGESSTYDDATLDRLVDEIESRGRALLDARRAGSHR